jgi:hypothetical protein
MLCISVFMCSAWVSEHRGIFSLYITKRMVFKTGTKCVYCAVRTRYLNVIHVNFQFLRGSPEYFVIASNGMKCNAGRTKRR